MKAPQVKDLPQEDQDRIHIFDVTMDTQLAEGRTLAEAHAAALRAVVAQEPRKDPDAWPFE